MIIYLNHLYRKYIIPICLRFRSYFDDIIMYWCPIKMRRNQEIGEKFRFYTVFFYFNPTPAGVLENQDMVGGGSILPPSKSHVLFQI